MEQRRDGGVSYKKEREERRAKNSKSYYVPSSVKHSDAGMAFEEIFKTIFDDLRENAKEKMKSLALEQEFITDMATDEALDYAFFSNAPVTFPPHEDRKITHLPESEILWIGFKNMERVFERELTKRSERHRDNWGKGKFKEVSMNIYNPALNKAFRTIFHEVKFKEVFENAKDCALDKVMESLICEEGYFDNEDNLELKMEKAYHAVLKEEIKKAHEESNLLGKIQQFLQLIWDKRFDQLDLSHYDVKGYFGLGWQ